MSKIREMADGNARYGILGVPKLQATFSFYSHGLLRPFLCEICHILSGLNPKDKMGFYTNSFYIVL